MHVSTTLEDGREPVDDDAVSTAIVREVARREGVPAVDLDSIYTVIDPDALEELFSPRYDGQPRPDGRVTFPYCGYEVTVTSDRTIHVEPLIEQQ
jgi:hypothetical protein